MTVSLAHLDQSSNAYETALTMKITNHRLTEDSEVLISIIFTATISSESDQTSTIEKYVLIFNIDDILIRGKKVFFKVIKTMKLLNK